MSPPPDVRTAFLSACDRLEPMRAGATLVLGCSAGGDSMGLLALCAEAAAERGFRLSVAHFDHASREGTEREAAFVGERAAALSLPFLHERAETSLAGAGEDVLRDARFRFFRRALESAAGSAGVPSDSVSLVLAHQRDDRAETMLMRLFNGSGPTGLASIRSIDRVRGMTILRPLLGVRRAALRAYLSERGLAWMDDPSNEDSTRRRAWLRREILPAVVAREGEKVHERIALASELIGEEAEALSEACDLLLREMRRPCAAGEAARLDLLEPVWSAAGRGLRRRLLRQWLWSLRERSPHPPGYGAVEEALNFVERGSDGAILGGRGGGVLESIHLGLRGGFLVAWRGRPGA